VAPLNVILPNYLYDLNFRMFVTHPLVNSIKHIIDLGCASKHLVKPFIPWLIEEWCIIYLSFLFFKLEFFFHLAPFVTHLLLTSQYLQEIWLLTMSWIPSNLFPWKPCKYTPNIFSHKYFKTFKCTTPKSTHIFLGHCNSNWKRF
jgi:hypothetical protein